MAQCHATNIQNKIKENTQQRKVGVRGFKRAIIQVTCSAALNNGSAPRFFFSLQPSDKL